MRTFLLILVTMLYLAQVTGAAALPKDAAFDKPVTLSVKGEDLSEVIKIIGKQTGADLALSPTLADQKMTILVDGKPARSVMDGIATLLDCEWVVEGKSCLLSDEQPRRQREEEEEQCRKAIAEGWDEADLQIKTAARLASKTKDELTKIYESARQADKSSKDLLREGNAARALLNNPLLGPCAEFYCMLSPELRSELRAGHQLYFNTKAPDQEWRIPEAVLSKMPGKSDSVAISLETEVRYQWVSVSARVSTSGRVAGKDGYITLAGSGGSSRPPVRQPRLPRTGDQAVLKQTVDIDDAILRETTGTAPDYPPSPVTIYDLLWLVHAKTGLQVIADYYSIADATPRSSLEVVRILSDSWHTGNHKWESYGTDYGWDGEFVYLRALDLRKAYAQDIPNNLLGKWNSAIAGMQFMDIDLLSEYAGLRDEQKLRTSVIYRETENLPAGRIHDDSIFKFYGLLSPQQRKEIFDKGTPVDKLTPEQRALLLEMCPRPRAKNSPNCLAGIYLDRLRRIDPLKGKQPVAVSMREGYDGPTEVQKLNYIEKNVDVIDRRGNKIDHVWRLEPTYTLTIHFDDGSVYERAVMVPVRVPIVRVKPEENNQENK